MFSDHFVKQLSTEKVSWEYVWWFHRTFFYLQRFPKECIVCNSCGFNALYKKGRDGEPIHKKYKANKSSRTQVTKEHNNQDNTNTLIK